MAVLCQWEILSLVCPSLHHSQLSAHQESKYHLLIDMVNWIFLRGEHNFSFPEIRSKMEEQKLASVRTSQEKWEEGHLLIEMRNSPVCLLGNHISCLVLAGIYRSHMCHRFSFSGPLHRRDSCLWSALTRPCPPYSANCHSCSQFQQDDSDPPGKPSRPTHWGLATTPAFAHLESCAQGAGLYIVCVRARVDGGHLSALQNCELQSVRKKKSSLNPSCLATHLAQANGSSFIPKNGLDCRLGRHLVPCGI